MTTEVVRASMDEAKTLPICEFSFPMFFHWTCFLPTPGVNSFCCKFHHMSQIICQILNAVNYSSSVSVTTTT